jgi:hypothetical protein
MQLNLPDPESPAFQAALWDFIASAVDGTASDVPDLLPIACTLAGMVAQLVTELHAVVPGTTREQAEERTADLIEAQRLLYGSLAEPA